MRISGKEVTEILITDKDDRLVALIADVGSIERNGYKISFNTENERE